MMSLTAEVQVDILVEEVVEGMPPLSKTPTIIRARGFRQSNSSATHLPWHNSIST